MTSSIKASELITALEKQSHFKAKQVEEKQNKKSTKVQKYTELPHEIKSDSIHPSTSAFLITLGLALGSGLYAWIGWFGVIGALVMIAGCLYIMRS